VRDDAAFDRLVGRDHVVRDAFATKSKSRRHPGNQVE